jgi:hypothetical protein
MSAWNLLLAAAVLVPVVLLLGFAGCTLILDLVHRAELSQTRTQLGLVLSLYSTGPMRVNAAAFHLAVMDADRRTSPTVVTVRTDAAAAIAPASGGLVTQAHGKVLHFEDGRIRFDARMNVTATTTSRSPWTLTADALNGAADASVIEANRVPLNTSVTVDAAGMLAIRNQAWEVVGTPPERTRLLSTAEAAALVPSPPPPLLVVLEADQTALGMNSLTSAEFRVTRPGEPVEIIPVALGRPVGGGRVSYVTITDGRYVTLELIIPPPFAPGEWSIQVIPTIRGTGPVPAASAETAVVTPAAASAIGVHFRVRPYTGEPSTTARMVEWLR